MYPRQERNHIMKTRIVRIGNSQGVRIPKPLLQRTGLRDEVEIEAEGNQIVIRPAAGPRVGWAEKFQAMARAGDDELLDPEVASQWDETEWQW
jgi:antitoxin MazE